MSISSEARRALLAAAMAFAAMPAANAQFPMQPMAPPVETGAIALGGSDVSRDSGEQWFRIGGDAAVRNVTHATLTPVLPRQGTGTGAAVVVAPGGGFLMLSMESEGWRIARWLADHGIAAFVLKYRLMPTPSGQEEFGRELGRLLAPRPGGSTGNVVIAAPEYAVQDGIAALRLVRARSAQWGVSPDRVGMLGFSAGAITTLLTTRRVSPADMPSFIATIYGPMDAVTVPKGAPPLFTVIAMDDPLFGRKGFGLVDAWSAAGRPVELHAYQAGGRGFGLGRAGTTSTDWITAFHHWLDVSGFLKGRP